MHAYFFYFFIFLFFLSFLLFYFLLFYYLFIFLFFWGWAGPSQHSPAQSGGTRNACVHSEGVIKFKLHSDFVMKNERGGNEKPTWSAGVAGGEGLGITLALEDSLLFLSVFYLLSLLASSVMCSLILLPRVCSFSFVTVFSGSYAFLCFFEKKQGNNSPAIRARPSGLFSCSLCVFISWAFLFL
jgi:hypothetical protein